MPAVVLEAQPDYRDLVSAICRRVGLEPECVADAAAVLQRAPAADCHLVVADVELLGGIAGVAAVRARSQVPLVVLDGPGSPERFLEAGADYHHVGLVALLLRVMLVLVFVLLALGGLGGRGPRRRRTRYERARNESPPCDPVLLVHPETALFA